MKDRIKSGVSLWGFLRFLFFFFYLRTKSQSSWNANGPHMDKLYPQSAFASCVYWPKHLDIVACARLSLFTLTHTWAVEASSRKESRCCSGRLQKQSRTCPKERHDDKKGDAANESASKVAVSLRQTPPFPKYVTSCIYGCWGGTIVTIYKVLTGFPFFHDIVIVISHYHILPYLTKSLLLSPFRNYYIKNSEMMSYYTDNNTFSGFILFFF